MIGRKTVAGAVVLLGVGMALAPAAGAAKSKKKPFKVVTASQSTTTNTAGPVTATATCPRGTQAISGGWRTVPTGDSFTAPVESVRVGSNQWKFTGVVGTGGTAQVVNAEANCAKLSGKIVEASVTVPFPGALNSQAIPIASCPPKTQLVSGGFSVPNIPAAFSILLLESLSTGPSSWGMKASRSIAAPDGTATATAYCLKKAKKKKKAKVSNPKALVTVTTPGSLSFLVGGQTLLQSAPCKRPRTSASGGFQTVIPGPQQGPAAVVESRIVNGVYTMNALQLSLTATQPSPLTAYEYCG